ncbi:unnamed protein product [Boreogadus saida]
MRFRSTLKSILSSSVLLRGDTTVQWVLVTHSSRVPVRVPTGGLKPASGDGSCGDPRERMPGTVKYDLGRTEAMEREAEQPLPSPLHRFDATRISFSIAPCLTSVGLRWGEILLELENTLQKKSEMGRGWR